jgi:hypothetical protein
MTSKIVSFVFSSILLLFSTPVFAGSCGDSASAFALNPGVYNGYDDQQHACSLVVSGVMNGGNELQIDFVSQQIQTTSVKVTCKIDKDSDDVIYVAPSGQPVIGLWINESRKPSSPTVLFYRSNFVTQRLACRFKI